jgi:PhnB protein
MNIPSGHQTVMPYLIIKNAAKFSEFTQRVFNAEEKNCHNRDDNHIMHAEIMIGDSTIMFADATDQIKEENAGLFINVENADETFQKALDEGATSILPLADQPYGRSGGVKDPFGNTWWITTPL